VGGVSARRCQFAVERGLGSRWRGWYVSMCTARVPNGLMSHAVRPEGSVITRGRR